MSLTRLLNYLPRGNLLEDAAWRKRHQFLLWVLFMHIPALFVLGLALGHSVANLGLFVLATPTACLLAGIWVRHRRVASFFVTTGLVYCSSALVGLTNGNIEAHFHFFIIIGFIALYQDWVPFLWNIVFTVLSHGIGTAWQTGLIFNHLPAQTNPWVWSAIHGIAVLFACVGVVIFWRNTEDEQKKTIALTTKLAEVEINQRRFASELLVNLARRNQSMLYRQLDIINQLEEKEHDPDALSELFQLDHLATRIRRNAESLLVLSGEEPTRVWSEPVRLIDVVRATIAETEDLNRVEFAVDERMEVLGHTVTDLTHMLAELTENAVRFSPPETNVTIRTRPYLRIPGAAVLTVEDWGVGMRPEDITSANELLCHPRDVDLSMSQRLGLHVVARLAARHHIQVSLTPTPGTGVTAIVVLPAELFAGNHRQNIQRLDSEKLAPVDTGARIVTPRPAGPAAPSMQAAMRPDIPTPRRSTNSTGSPQSNGTANGTARGLHARPDHDDDPDWAGWWTPIRQPTMQVSGQTSGQTSSCQAGPVYTTAEPVVGEVAPLVRTMALPAPPPPRANVPAPAPVVIARATPRSAESTSSAAAMTTEPTIGPASEAGSDTLLTRRVPQSNLAPELRRLPSSGGGFPESSSGAGVPQFSTTPDAERARDALSRFQASRQAAQQQVGADDVSPPNGTGPGS